MPCLSLMKTTYCFILSGKQDILREKLEEQHDKLGKVKWGDKEVDNCWVFEYLGSDFVPNGDHTSDLRKRIAQAMSRVGRLRHITQAQDVELDV